MERLDDVRVQHIVADNSTKQIIKVKSVFFSLFRKVFNPSQTKLTKHLNLTFSSFSEVLPVRKYAYFSTFSIKELAQEIA